MNWASERYVRIYIRDTADWMMMPWQSRALLPLLLRKMDRTGVVDLGKHGRAVLGHVVGLPDDVALTGLDGLLFDGCVIEDGNSLICRNFVEAQTTRSNDSIRQADSRHGKKMREASVSHPQSHCVTQRHLASPEVTSCHSSGTVLSGTEPSGTEATTSSVATDPPHAPLTLDLEPAPSKPSGPKPEALMEAWNANCGKLPSWSKMTDKRRRQSAARLRERPLDGPDGWIAVIRRMEASDLCNGRVGSGWRASPDFLLQPDASVKVLEGKYDNRTVPARPTQAPARDGTERRVYTREEALAIE